MKLYVGIPSDCWRFFDAGWIRRNPSALELLKHVSVIFMYSQLSDLLRHPGLVQVDSDAGSRV